MFNTQIERIPKKCFFCKRAPEAQVRIKSWTYWRGTPRRPIFIYDVWSCEEHTEMAEKHCIAEWGKLS